MNVSNLTHRERLEKLIAGEKIDRLPVALWRHFPVDDQSADGLAAATINYQQSFDFDFVKISPSSSFCLQDWGVTSAWSGSKEGTREYTRRVIHHPEDWSNLPVLDPRSGRLGEQLQAAELITNGIGIDTPVIQTVFSPLSQAKNLIGPNELVVSMRKHPEELLSGLQTITETIIQFIRELEKTGISGLFYAIQHAQYGLVSQEEYQEFGKKF
nr:uroporphyrinogen decarboxylase [candidate division Zixibacteria bacterium]NIR65219.1 uroporphyrinogen decarboxylase [candidate division Zixibacteria bacterium]NIS46955.1 uroporphyrinogen decarboxylase [candidate division Zixibacteria bacterium]NIT51369.1 uroporphyrinogen decarboxylase [candidate division Zixibacteria bacterium]NIU15107.1 uroporphyrinogen decarboxylase [candidate division Zixibacteria bacterium]